MVIPFKAKPVSSMTHFCRLTQPALTAPQRLLLLVVVHSLDWWASPELFIIIGIESFPTVKDRNN